MLIEIKVPIPGESINQVILSKLLVENGSIVDKGVEIAEIDSDKATLSITSEHSGKINFLAEEGDTVDVSSILATIDTDFEASQDTPKYLITQDLDTSQHDSKGDLSNVVHVTPLANQMMQKEHVSVQELDDFLHHRKITKNKVEMFLSEREFVKEVSLQDPRTQNRSKMSPLRQKLSQRLVSVKNETAMLTTFNEIDMSFVMEAKKENSEVFFQKHGVSLGYMSFFTKAVSIALKMYPMVNSQIDGDEIVSFDYSDISIAVSTPKGLLVPVIRNVEQMSISDIELEIKKFADKARENKLTLEEMQGGTFTITNGGVFGSLMSTPILNPPQSAILGMHAIQERPIAFHGQVVIKPMMYVALSYDHRIIDGRDSVGFLKTIKELIENPLKMLNEGRSPIKVLLDL